MNFSHGKKVSVDKNDEGKKDNVPQKKVSKKIGDYIDYEEIKK